MHAEQPLIPFRLSDGERLVGTRDAHCILALEVKRRPAVPAAHELKELLTHRAQILGVHGSDAPRLGRLVHDVVEAVHEAANAGLAAAALTACSRSSEVPATTTGATEASKTGETRKFVAFRIGDFEAMALRDGSLEFANDGKVSAINRSPEDVAGLLTAAGLPVDELHLGLQPLLVRRRCAHRGSQPQRAARAPR